MGWASPGFIIIHTYLQAWPSLSTNPLPRLTNSLPCQPLSNKFASHQVSRLTMRTMVSVASLLNPLTPENEQANPLPNPCSMLYSPEPSARIPLLRKQKLCKDEATFIKGKPQEEVKYWPCEYQDGVVAAEHRKYQLYPIGHITEYCKHVPYRSEKKTFLSRTGREGFHGNTCPSCKTLFGD